MRDSGMKDQTVLTPLLHVHAQEAWHDPAFIVGDRSGLMRLRDLIDTALTDGRASGELMCADGEGFTLTVFLSDEGFDAAGRTWKTPYTEEVARDHRPHAIDPADR